MSPLIKHTNVHTQMSSSICMTAGDDNDELEETICFPFKRMSSYDYVYVGAVHKSRVFSRTFHYP